MAIKTPSQDICADFGDGVGANRGVSVRKPPFT